MTSQYDVENFGYTGTFNRTGTSKGTTLINDGTGLFDLLTVGANATILTADSAETNGRVQLKTLSLNI